MQRVLRAYGEAREKRRFVEEINLERRKPWH